ncbi:MAG: LysM peptidoglycan-binding domain-containing protein, partial [Pseudomonadota bacterium]
MKRVVLAIATAFGLCSFSITSDAPAQTLACGTQYSVKPGDSLSGIARRVYGDPGSFTVIYNANTSAIGANPGIIEIGVVLNIPCIDGVEQAPAAELVRAEPTTAALPAPELNLIRLVTGDDWAPFTNESHPTGGLAVEVANVALSVAEKQPDFKIDFINDWGAHLQPLITDHAYDFSLVWFRPNCDLVDRLSDDSKFRCNNLDWSDPIFQQIIGYYTRTDAPRPNKHADLFGKTVCRPSGYSTFMMEEVYLVEPNITFKRPTMTTDCFEELVNGNVDAVVLAADVAEG